MKPQGNVFSRLVAGQYLSPVERTVLKLLEGLIASGIVAGLTAAIQYIAMLLTGGSFSWTTAIAVFVSGALVGMLLAAWKYVSAHKDDNVFLSLLNQALASPSGQQAQQTLEVDIEKLAGQIATNLGGKIPLPPVPSVPPAGKPENGAAVPPTSPFPPSGA